MPAICPHEESPRGWVHFSRLIFWKLAVLPAELKTTSAAQIFAAQESEIRMAFILCIVIVIVIVIVLHASLSLCLSLPLSLSLSIYIYIYIYIIHMIYRPSNFPKGQKGAGGRLGKVYIYRERERDIYIYIYMYAYTSIYIYIYTRVCVYLPT